MLLRARIPGTLKNPMLHKSDRGYQFTVTTRVRFATPRMFCGELYVSNWIVCSLSATYAWSHICYCGLHCPSYQFSAAGMLKLTSYRFWPLAFTRFFFPRTAKLRQLLQICAHSAVSFRKLNVLNWILNIENIQSVSSTERLGDQYVRVSHAIMFYVVRHYDFFPLLKFHCNIDLQRAVYQREIALGLC